MNIKHVVLDTLDDFHCYNFVLQLIVFAKDSVDPVNHTSARQLFVVVLDTNDNNATFTNPKNYPACHAVSQLLTQSIIRIFVYHC